jgi:hypothetical protein
MRFRPTPFLVLTVLLTACHDQQLASPYTDTLRRQEAEVVVYNLLFWTNMSPVVPGDAPIDSFRMPPIGHRQPNGCWKGGRVLQSWNQKRTWDESTRTTVIDDTGWIDQEACKYHTVRGLTFTLDSDRTVGYKSHTEYLGTDPVGVLTDHIQGMFSWGLADGRRGKCVIDYRYAYHVEEKIEERVGNVCGHHFNEIAPWRYPI